MPGKAKGVSSKVRVKTGIRRGLQTTSRIRPNRTAAERALAAKDYNDQVAQLSFLQREELLVDAPMPQEQYDASFDIGGDHSGSDGGWTDNEMEVDGADGFRTFPPGEEGLLQSHAGGEAIFQQIWERAKPGRGDSRRRRHRVQKQVDSWARQLPTLIDAYLHTNLNGPIVSDGCTPGVWHIEALGFSEHGLKPFGYTSDSRNANETLIRHGYIGGSPDQPSIAFSLKTFEVYRQIHRVCPRFSLEGLARVLCYLHMGPRKANLAEQLTTVYDAYLAIVRGVDQRTQAALGRDEQWRAKNICPPCFYKLTNEARLKFSWLGCMDGNNSLKLIDSTFRAGLPRFDNRKSDSFRWLTTAEVDVFKDEVKNSEKIPMATAAALAAVTESLAASAAAASPPPTSAPTPNSDTLGAPPPSTSADDDGDIAWLNINELTGDESDELERCVNTCVERWKNAGPEARKKMFALFAISGIFLSVCRHGHVIVMCDMIRSGELMKYPLAIIKRLLDLYGEDAGIGYDIMCAFYKTLLRSSLGQRVVALRLRGVVPTWHGHAHNRCCQLGWHPMYTEGAGLEDFKECERTFGLSNNLATVTRHATPFHRQQQIDEHFNFHDNDKHAASGNFIFQNYHQATEKIAMNTVHLQALEQRLNTTSADYESYLVQERNHLEALKREPPEVIWTVEYMELLQKRDAAEKASITASQDHRNLDYHIIHSGWTTKKIKDVRTKYRTTHTRALMVEEELTHFEEEHSIERRWVPASTEYKDAIVMMSQRRYRRALDEVERLVVQRLLEMTKLGASGVAYKLREKIGKALKTRATAIQRALADYNAAAAQISPPREPLTWAQVADTVTVAGFDLLRDTRSDIRKLPWADPARREAMVLYFGIKRAKEEIQRLNVEIRHLVTFMIDDHADYVKAMQAQISPSLADLPLAHELSRQWEHRSNIHRSIVERLVKTSRLIGFTGSLLPGEHEGREMGLSCEVALPSWAVDNLGLTQVIVDYEEENNAQDTAREFNDVDDDLLEHVMDQLHLGT